MSRTIRVALLGALLAGSAAVASPLRAQGFGDRLKRAAGEAAKRKVEERVDERSGEATDAALDAAETGAKKGAKKGAAPAKGASDSAASANGGASGSGAAAAGAGAPGTGMWVNYDFVPGDRVLFAEDFSRDAVGDFPRRLQLARGNMEVAEWSGRRWLRMVEDDGEFSIPLPERLPERFTIEFEYAGMYHDALQLHFDDRSDEERQRIVVGSWGAGVEGAGLEVTTKPGEAATNGVALVRVMVDGRYAKVYVNDRRVANVPNADLGRAKRIRVTLSASDDDRPTLLGGFRVAEGGKDLYEALAADGRVATHGILFDTGSDRLRGESTPTLERIAAMLSAHPELRLRIEGHTDDVGDAAANRTLSERRAAAVKAYLVGQQGVAAGRLETAGFGSTKPTAPNTTAEGRQTNRRVELVRL